MIVPFHFLDSVQNDYPRILCTPTQLEEEKAGEVGSAMNDHHHRHQHSSRMIRESTREMFWSLLPAFCMYLFFSSFSVASWCWGRTIIYEDHNDYSSSHFPFSLRNLCRSSSCAGYGDSQCNRRKCSGTTTAPQKRKKELQCNHRTIKSRVRGDKQKREGTIMSVYFAIMLFLWHYYYYYCYYYYCSHYKMFFRVSDATEWHG